MKKEKPNKADRKTDSYTIIEVGTLLEEIRSDVKRVTEGHSGIDKRLEDIEVSNHGIQDRLQMVELSNSIIKGKVSRLEDAASKLLADLKGTRQELKDTREELKGDIRAFGDRLSAVGNAR